MSKPKLKDIQEWVKTQVSPYRFKHIQGVAKTAGRLAARYRLPVSKALLAAWLHDCAKELTKAEMQSWLKNSPFKLDGEEQTMPGLWHPHAAAAIALKKWGIKDREVLEAIRCHTLGHPTMRRLAQAIFVADFIEPGRKFPGVLAARKSARKNLTKTVLMKASMTISVLFDQKKKIHYRLLETWNSFLNMEKHEEP